MRIAEVRGRVYQYSIDTVACDGGFRAAITRVLLMNVKTGVGQEVEPPSMPEQPLASALKAEQVAEAFFRLWAAKR